MITIQPARQYKKPVVDLLVSIFSNLSGLDMDEELKDTDWDLSMALLDKDTVIGFYLVAAMPDPFNKLQGSCIQGIAIGVEAKYRNQGLKQAMMEKTDNLGFDYFWGECDKRLNNLDLWLKNSMLYLGENKDSFFIYKKLK